jgi:hypothetical protein
MQVTVGRIVNYTLTANDATRINKRRFDADISLIANAGAQAHTGNTMHEGDILPMIVVRVWQNELVNGQVFLDGNDTLWVMSVPKADPDKAPLGSWDWPARV